jgi:hypothetical protein
VSSVLVILIVTPAIVGAQTSEGIGGAPPIILSVGAQNRQLFATWNRQSDATYLLRWRRHGVGQWDGFIESTTPYAAIDSLTNGESYDVQLVVQSGSNEFPSQVITQVPRVRDDCTYGTALFCSEEAFIAALPRYGLERNSLSCRGQVVPQGRPLPNCIYTMSGTALGLNRSYGERFRPGSNRPSADVVRKVLQNAIWGTSNFEEVRHRYEGKGPPLAIPYAGRVDATAQVQSFLVPIASTIFSRVSWFVRPDHVPGRYAIYHEGHGESAVSSGATVINWLLNNGWQVLALDMPLEGVNEEDRTSPLYDHDSFATLDNGDAVALKWFFIPLVAVTNWIEEDYKKEGNPTVMLVGRSGGGWTAFTYAAMDTRVDISVNIAGGAPLSTLLDSTAFNRLAPHYEAQPDFVYDQVSLTDIMLTAGTAADFFFYSEFDPCCYRFSPRNTWIRYLQSLSDTPSGKQYEVFLDQSPLHGLSPQGLAMFGQFLKKRGLGPLPPAKAATSEPD